MGLWRHLSSAVSHDFQPLFISSNNFSKHKWSEKYLKTHQQAELKKQKSYLGQISLSFYLITQMMMGAASHQGTRELFGTSRVDHLYLERPEHSAFLPILHLVCGSTLGWKEKTIKNSDEGKQSREWAAKHLIRQRLAGQLERQEGNEVHSWFLLLFPVIASFSLQ